MSSNPTLKVLTAPHQSDAVISYTRAYYVSNVNSMAKYNFSIIFDMAFVGVFIQSIQ